MQVKETRSETLLILFVPHANDTLPKTNMFAPENKWFPIGISFSRGSIFRGYVSLRKGFPTNLEGQATSQKFRQGTVVKDVALTPNTALRQRDGLTTRMVAIRTPCLFFQFRCLFLMMDQNDDRYDSWEDSSTVSRFEL